MTDVGFHPPPALEALLPTLDSSSLQRDLRRLCEPDFGGRRIGTVEHERAVAWLSARMDQLGLAVEPFDFTLALPVLALTQVPALARHTPLDLPEQVDPAAMLLAARLLLATIWQLAFS